MTPVWIAEESLVGFWRHRVSQHLVEAHDTAVRYRLEQLFEVGFQAAISLAEYL